MAVSSTAHQGPAPPRSPGSNRRGGPGRGHLGPSASPPALPFPTRAGGRTCSSTVLGVTFTVWRRPFGASTDTAEPPPPAGAAIFRSRDRGRLASNYFICNSRDARPRGLGAGPTGAPPQTPPLAPWSRPWLCRCAEQAGTLVPMESPKGLFGVGCAHCGQGRCLFIPRPWSEDPSRSGDCLQESHVACCQPRVLQPPVCHRVLDIPTP